MIDNAGGRFTVNAQSGVLSLVPGIALDYELQTSHAVKVGVTADGVTIIKDFTINVKDILEARPVNLSNALVAENAIGAAIGTVAIMTGAAYSLVDNAGGRFVINATTGALSLLQG